MASLTTIQKELQEIKRAIAKLAGTASLPIRQQLSAKAIDNAARKFKELAEWREQWIKASNLATYLKGISWHNHKFLQQQFNFTAFMKVGTDYYYNKAAVVALAEELKKRNVQIEQFYNLYTSQKQFEKAYEKYKADPTAKANKAFEIPDWLKDIISQPLTPPKIEVVENYIFQLQTEFFELGYGEYIDIHNGYAIPKFFKNDDHYELYLPPGLMKKVDIWSYCFNTASKHVEELTGEKRDYNPYFRPLPKES